MLCGPGNIEMPAIRNGLKPSSVQPGPNRGRLHPWRGLLIADLALAKAPLKRSRGRGSSYGRSA
jgi:hypothetical protein